MLKISRLLIKYEVKQNSANQPSDSDDANVSLEHVPSVADWPHIPSRQLCKNGQLKYLQSTVKLVGTRIQWTFYAIPHLQIETNATNPHRKAPEQRERAKGKEIK